MDRTISRLKRNSSILKNGQTCSYITGNRDNKMQNRRDGKRSANYMYTGNNLCIDPFQILLSLTDFISIFANITLLFYITRELIYYTRLINCIIQPCENHQSQGLNDQQSEFQSNSIPNVFNASYQHDALIRKSFKDSLNDGSSWGQFVEVDLSK